MSCQCTDRRYCKVGLGFNMMSYTDPCKSGLLSVDSEAIISDEGEIQEEGIQNTESRSQKKPGIPWWLIIAGGYLLYKEGTGL